MLRFALFLAPVLLMGQGCASDTVPAPPVGSVTVGLDPSAPVVGGPLEVEYRFELSGDTAPLTEDYTVFVHVLDAAGAIIGGDDHDPPTPTSRWRAGTAVSYARLLFIPRTLSPGPATIEVGLYAPARGDRLPLVGSGTREPGAVQVASFDARPEPHPPIFVDGFHPPEPHETTRWTMKAGRLGFVNPRRGATLFVQLDRPVHLFPVEQHVEIRVNETTVDEFDLPRGMQALRRVALTPTQMGEAERIDVQIVADKTFVPARVPELESTDTRQLGVRLWHVFLGSEPGETGLH